MILFFDLEKLESDTSKTFLKRLSNFYINKNLMNKSSKDWLLGNSFILNPKPLLINKELDPVYLVQYIKLAGRRDYSLYRYYGAKTLQISYFPDLNLNSIKTNPLLKISQTEIMFFYEECLRNN